MGSNEHGQHVVQVRVIAAAIPREIEYLVVRDLFDLLKIVHIREQVVLFGACVADTKPRSLGPSDELEVQSNS